MSAAPRTEMIAAAGALEDALQQLTSAYTRYAEAYRVVSRGAHPNENQQLLLEDTIGISRVSGLIVQRLRALGLEAVLQRARALGTIDETWVTALEAKIERFVL